MTTEAVLCQICGEPAADAKLLSDCMSCGRVFHLNPYNNDEHKDCGDAMLGPSQGVEFWCQVCLAELEVEMAEQQPDPRMELERMADPGGLFSAIRPPEAAAPPATPVTPAAPATPETSRGASEAPPTRKRSGARRRYRRIDR